MRRFSISLVVLILITGLFTPQIVKADEHIVSPSDLHKAIQDRSDSRQANLNQVDNFFSSSEAQQALRQAKLDPQQVRTAISSLSDEDLARLAAKTTQAQKDFAAGALTHRQVTYVIIAVTLVVIILILAAS